MGLSVFSLPVSFDDCGNMFTSFYCHNQIGNMTHWPLCRVTSCAECLALLLWFGMLHSTLFVVLINAVCFAIEGSKPLSFNNKCNSCTCIDCLVGFFVNMCPVFVISRKFKDNYGSSD